MEWSTIWTAVEAVATAATAVGIFYAAQQIRLQAWLRATDLFTTPEFIQARTRILRRTLDAPWEPDDEEAAWVVCRRMDEIARLAPYFHREEILDAWDDPFAKLWDKLKGKVDEERKRVQWKRKWAAFEDLGREAADKLEREGRPLRRSQSTR